MEASEQVDSDGIEEKKHNKISEVKNSFLLCARRDGYRNNGKSNENKPNRRYRSRTHTVPSSLYVKCVGFSAFSYSLVYKYTYICTHLFIFQVQSSSSDGVGDDNDGISSSSFKTRLAFPRDDGDDNNSHLDDAE